MQLEVDFVPRGDRRAHQLIIQLEQTRQLVASSVEGSEVDEWPPSPPMVVVEPGSLSDGRQVMFGIGMSGGGHWSLSVEADETQTRRTFDVACRIASMPRFLGSTYNLAPAMQVRSRGDLRQIRLCGHSLGVTIRTLMGQIQMNDAGCLVIQPDLSGLSFPATVRWKYQIECRHVGDWQAQTM